MSHDDVLFAFRLRPFTLAEQIGVRPACRAMGVHHSIYYRWKAKVDRWTSRHSGFASAGAGGGLSAERWEEERAGAGLQAGLPVRLMTGTDSAVGE